MTLKRVKANRGSRKPVRGQGILEMAFVGLFLALLLAGAVDLGRAYYTAVIVANMAGEGASYGAIHPDEDINRPTAADCSEFSVADDQNIQDRARDEARSRGLVVSNPGQSDIQ